MQAVRDAQDLSKDLSGNRKEISQNLNISISLGSQKSESNNQALITEAKTSNINSNKDVNITATKDINVIGTEITGENINLKATDNINLQSAENKIIQTENNSQSGSSIGVVISTKGITPTLSTNKAKENGNGTTTTHTITKITANQTLNAEADKDINLKGAQVSADKIKITAGGNLNLESQQDTDTYKETSSSSGINLSLDKITNANNKIVNKLNAQGSSSKGKIDSNYQSVTEQTGIYAGKQGFDIKVGKNTDLKGAVIASEADASKNKLSTDTLTYSDIENKAEYSASSTGNFTQSGSKLPITPNATMPVSGDAKSITKAAIANGNIDVRSNPNQDLSKLNRETEKALNSLEKIFDKETVKEKQELANLFGQEAFKTVGDIAEKQREKATTKEEKEKWGEGGEYKIILHAVVGGVMAELGGNKFTSGALGAGVSQALQKELSNIKDSNLRLIASYIVGATAAKIAGGKSQVGGSSAYTGTKYNDYIHRPTTVGAIIYSNGDENGEGRGYYVVNSDGKEKYLSEGVKSGDIFWEADGEYIDGQQMGNEYIIGDNGEHIGFFWQEKTTVYGDYNDQLKIYVAVNLETREDVNINGHVVLKNDTGAIYNKKVEEYEEQTYWSRILASLAMPGSSVQKVETVTEISTAKATEEVMDEAMTVAGASETKTTLDLIKDVTIQDGKYYAPKATIDEIGQLEARGVDFSKLDSKVMSSRVSTEGGTSRVIKYSDSDGIKFIIHEVTDEAGNVLHRDFDAVRIESGQLINKG